MIGIVDMEMGNLRSVSNAVHSLGFDFKIVRGPEALDGISHLIVPGVGAYSTAMHHLERQGLKVALAAYAASGRPLLGICLGMHLLSSEGEEGGRTAGLGLVPGRVVKLVPGAGLAVPHVGWNNADFRATHPILDKVRNGADFYFVHSYQFVCDQEPDVIASTDYGPRLVSILGRKNVVGFQFHPEKSQANGLRLIENFCDWDGRC